MDLNKIFTELKNPGSYRGINAFFKYAKAKYPQVTRKEVKEFLMKTDSYTLHKPKRRVKKFRKIYSKGISYQYQMDLVDLKKFKSENDGYSWLLNIIG